MFKSRDYILFYYERRQKKTEAQKRQAVGATACRPSCSYLSSRVPSQGLRLENRPIRERRGKRCGDNLTRTALSVLLHWPLAQNAGRVGMRVVGALHTTCLKDKGVWLDWASGGLSHHSPSCGQGWCDLTLVVRHSIQVSEVLTLFAKGKKTNFSKELVWLFSEIIIKNNKTKTKTKNPSKPFDFLLCLFCNRKKGNHCTCDLGVRQKCDIQA